MQEEFKDITGYEGLYQVSNLGRVKSLERVVNHSKAGFKRIRKEIILKNADCGGYLRVDLYSNGLSKCILVHRLVALTFIKNPLKKKTINHINGIKSDNRVENLEWATEKENTIHSIEIGLRNNRGVNNYQSRLSEQDVILIRNSNDSLNKLAIKFNVSKSCIYLIKKRKTYKSITEQTELLKELKSRL